VCQQYGQALTSFDWDTGVSIRWLHPPTPTLRLAHVNTCSLLTPPPPTHTQVLHARRLIRTSRTITVPSLPRSRLHAADAISSDALLQQPELTCGLIDPAIWLAFATWRRQRGEGESRHRRFAAAAAHANAAAPAAHAHKGSSPPSFARDSSYGLGDTFDVFRQAVGPSMLAFMLETNRTFLHLIRPELKNLCRRVNAPNANNGGPLRVPWHGELQRGSNDATSVVNVGSSIRLRSSPTNDSHGAAGTVTTTASPSLLHVVALGTPLFDLIPSYDASLKLHDGGPPIAVDAGDIGSCTLVMTVFDRRDQMLDRLMWYQPLLCLRSIVVVWNAVEFEPPVIDNAAFRVPVVVEQHAVNSLNNRWRPRRSVNTECVINVDDDWNAPLVLVSFAVRLWRRSFPRRLVGLLKNARTHGVDSQGRLVYLKNVSAPQSIVLPSMLVYHKDYLDVCVHLLLLGRCVACAPRMRLSFSRLCCLVYSSAVP
jgi:hypothetical protein